jgi:hypothetical protein
MPQSAEEAIAAIEQRRIDALIASDINALDEIIDEHCTHIESNGTSRTKAAFLADVAKRQSQPCEARTAPAGLCKPWRKLEAGGASSDGDRAKIKLRHDLVNCPCIRQRLYA